MPRIKVPPEEGGANYHCYSRTVNGEWLFQDADKEMLRIFIWQIGEFCGVQVYTHTVMSNHFHVVVHVPRAGAIDDEELLRRYVCLFPKPTRRRPQTIEQLRTMLKRNGADAASWRRSILRMMGDISAYLKLLKQYFTTWFNRTHRRFGTLWAQRFGSVLVEPGAALAAVMAYVDLNCVRAGIVEDPKDYRFCGYAEAVAGVEPARRGLKALYERDDWESVQAEYRVMLFAIGAVDREGAATIAAEQFERVMKEGGQLSVATVVRCRVRYFTYGAVLGTQAFVERQLKRLREKTGLPLRAGPKPLPSLEGWGEWVALRHVRRGPLEAS